MIDFGTLFSQLIASFWWLLPLFVLAARLFLDKNDDYLIKNVNRPGRLSGFSNRSCCFARSE